MARKSQEKWEYGDFQTPAALAEALVAVLHTLQIRPATVLEPTCGKGAFLLEAMRVFPQASRFVGVDINRRHLTELERHIPGVSVCGTVSLLKEDFFRFEWQTLLSDLPQPILLLGNPPWVTSAELGLLGSSNLPGKSNFQGHRGYDALTGKSNFDISEWMLLQQLDWLADRQGILAMLCKTAVARKILSQAWKRRLAISYAHMFGIDAQTHFDASVDACFLVIAMLGERGRTECNVYDDPQSRQPARTIGWHEGIVLANVDSYNRWRHFVGGDDAYAWRSGIKHDCSKVMEFEPDEGRYRNGMGELVELENECLYPLLKSSDIANGQVRYGRKYMLVTQRYVGEDTALIRNKAPKTWRYLEAHEEMFTKRASSIYRGQVKYSIFGVGDYSFAPWKVAISGFYKNLSFKIVTPYDGKSVVLDDTAYFLPCWSEAEACFVESLLSSTPARQFFESMIFWSDKRPITSEILRRLNLHAVSIELGCEPLYLDFARRRKDRKAEVTQGQLSFGIAEKKAQYAAGKT